MISEHELRRIAGRGGVGIGQAEHEYVVLCTLDALSQVAPLSKTFCLKGGTALSQLYFPIVRLSSRRSLGPFRCPRHQRPAFIQVALFSIVTNKLP